MRGGALSLLIASVLLGSTPVRALPRLQQLVDGTPEGGLLRLEAGRYAGGVVVRRPIVIDGGGVATVDGGGRGSVFVVRSRGVTLRRLHITGSGSNHDALDAGVQIRGDGNVVEENRIDDCLFGVDLAQANANLIRGNRIRSKEVDLGVRGDAIRLWYSRENEVVDNLISDVRDVVVWYSGANHIARNQVTRSRYALHFMYSERNQVEENLYVDNMVGIFLMYSDGVEIRRNRIIGAQGATGMGVGFKESSNVFLQGNEILYCAKGVYLDISPYEPDTTNRFEGNSIGYNGVGVMFHSRWHGNVFRENDFIGNFTQVAVRGGGDAMQQEWQANYWDDYQGFDLDADGVGDRPHRAFAYADRVWMEVPDAGFFRGSLLFEALDFLDRLAPFVEPLQILEDPSPRFQPRTGARRSGHRLLDRELGGGG